MTRLGYHTIHHSPMFGGRQPILDVIAATAAAGFDAIGIDRASHAAHLAAGGTADEVRRELKRARLAVSDVLVLAAGDDSDLLADARQLGELGRSVGAAWCIAAVSSPIPFDTLVGSLRDASAVLADHGLRMAFEFTPYTPLRSFGAAVTLATAIGWEHCALVLDSLHWFRTGEPLESMGQLEPEQIGLVQFSDAPAARPVDLITESRHGRLVPGTGGLALAAWVDAVRSTGWDGLVSAEVLSAPLRSADPRAGAVACHDAMNALWNG